MPLIYLVVRAGEVGGETMAETLFRARTVRLVGSSLGLVAAVTASCVVLGTATAWVLTRVALPWRPLWLVLAAVPLAVPSYVAAYGWMATMPGINGFVPAWLILTAVSTPYVTLPVAAALRVADPAAAEVARSLGRGPVAAWRTATLPQIAPAVAAGALLAALYVLSDFGAVALLRFEVFTFAISRQYGSFIGRDRAVILALVLVVLALLLVAGERRVRGRASAWRVGSGAVRRPPAMRPGPWLVPILVGLAIVPSGAVAVPAVALFRRLMEGTGRPLDWSELLSAVTTTAAIGAAGAALALALALPIGWLSARYRGRWVTTIEAGGFTGHALPGIVVGLSLVYVSLNLVPGLYQTTFVLVFAYAVLFLPKAIGSSRSAIAAVPPGLQEVARSLGRGPVASARATVVRLASPGIAAGALLVMLTAMKELPATLVLRPNGFDTLATEIWSRTSAAAYGAAAPYALALIMVAVVPAFLLSLPRSWEGHR